MQRDPERRAAGLTGDQFHRPAQLLLDEIPADEQAQACAGVLGGEVGLEDPVEVLGRDAPPVVGDVDLQRPRLQPRHDFDGAPFFGGVHCVENQVQEDLDELIPDRVQGRNIRDESRDDPLALLSLVVLGDAQSVADHVVEVTAGVGQIRRPAEVDQLPQRPLNPAELVVDELQFLPRVLVDIPPIEQLHQRTDRRQRVAHFVRDAGCEQAEGGLFFLLDQERLRFLQFLRPLPDAEFEQPLVFLKLGV